MASYTIRSHHRADGELPSDHRDGARAAAPGPAGRRRSPAGVLDRLRAQRRPAQSHRRGARRPSRLANRRSHQHAPGPALPVLLRRAAARRHHPPGPGPTRVRGRSRPSDRLYEAILPAVTSARLQPPTWTALPYDGVAARPRLVIAGVTSSEASTGGYLVADLVRDPDSNTREITRYFIDPAKPGGRAWQLHDVPVDIEAGDYVTALGRKGGAGVDGIYTSGQIDDRPQIVYTPAVQRAASREPPAVGVPEADSGRGRDRRRHRHLPTAGRRDRSLRDGEGRALPLRQRQPAQRRRRRAADHARVLRRGDRSLRQPRSGDRQRDGLGPQRRRRGVRHDVRHRRADRGEAVESCP